MTGTKEMTMPQRAIALPFVHGGFTDYLLRPSSFESGSGFVVNRLEDSQDLRWERIRGENGLWAFRVAGTSHRAGALSAGDFSPGSPLLLIPDPENQYDPNAIGVWDQTRTHHIGFVPAELLDDIGPIIRGGGPHGCIVLWEHRDGGRRVAVRALLATGGVRVSLPRPKPAAPTTVAEPALRHSWLLIVLLAAILAVGISTC